jgi:hypothetical protein
MNKSIKIEIIIFLIYQASCFIFHAPTINCDNFIINKQTSCSIILSRWMTDVFNVYTDYLNESVPSGSDIVITFPQEYTLYNN